MTLCRLCREPYLPWPRTAADDRCGACKAARRYWRPEQIGTRAQVWITDPESAFHDETGVGTRVSTPEDGWMVALLSGGPPMFFGAGVVSVDFELRRVPQAERSVWAMAAGRRNGHTSPGMPILTPGEVVPVVCDVPGRRASQGARNAK